MHPSIAVVIPAFNSESTINTAIVSALSQSRPPEEVIVVDDGSTDATAEIVRSYGTVVKLISQANQGSAVARQTGTDASSSDFIAYLDADDWWPIDKLSVCSLILAHEQVDFLLADLQRAHPGSPPESYLPRNSTFFPRMWNFLNNHEVSSDIPGLYRIPPALGLSLLLDGFPVFPSTALIRKSVIQTVGGWDARFRRCQDFDLGLRIARQFPLHYLDQVQAILGLHDINYDAHPYVVKQLEGDIRVLEAHYNAEPIESPYRQQIAKALSRKMYSLGNSHLNAGNTLQARKAYRRAVHWPGKRMHAIFKLVLSMQPWSKQNSLY